MLTSSSPLGGCKRKAPETQLLQQLQDQRKLTLRCDPDAAFAETPYWSAPECQGPHSASPYLVVSCEIIGFTINNTAII